MRTQRTIVTAGLLTVILTTALWLLPAGGHATPRPSCATVIARSGNTCVATCFGDAHLFCESDPACLQLVAQIARDLASSAAGTDACDEAVAEVEAFAATVCLCTF
jgi:hypothetical protein